MTRNEPSPRFLTVQETAVLLASRKAVNAMAERSQLPGVIRTAMGSGTLQPLRPKSSGNNSGKAQGRRRASDYAKAWRYAWGLLKTTGDDANELTRALKTLEEQGDIYIQDGGHWPVQ
jgi:hypothetical protein